MQLHLDFSELEHLAALARHLAMFNDLEQHRRFRPPAHERPTGHARKWWQVRAHRPTRRPAATRRATAL